MVTSEALAMEKAKELLRQYVLAGFTKIHIDTSMHLGDDNHECCLDTATIAKRGAILCNVAQEAYKELKQINPAVLEPVYVVGSEVPIPGGSQEEEGIQITRVVDFKDTVETFKKAFLEYKLEDAWENIIAVVVQPGVEFGDETILYMNTSEKQQRIYVRLLENIQILFLKGIPQIIKQKNA